MVLRLDQGGGAFRHGVGRARRGRAKELAGVGMLRVGEKRGGGAGFHDLAILHHTDPVSNALHDPEVVGDEEKPHPLVPLEICQQFKDLGLDGDIERGRGFVRDQDIRLVRQRHGDHHPLALAAGQLVRIRAKAAFGVADADAVHKVDDTFPHLCPAHALMQFDRFAQLLFQRVQRVERGHRFLEDERDVVAAHLSQVLIAGTDHFLAVIGDAAGDARAVSKKRHGRQSRDRFARAAFPDNGNRLAAIHGEGDALDRLFLDPVLPEGDAQVVDLQKAH